MRLAADRGVTICFADLDGADGLWVPEERTILVSRALPEERVDEVIEHELAHVAIDDQHAALDAGVFRPPPGPVQTLLARRWATPVLSAAAFVALVGGVTAGLAAALPDGNAEVIAPTPTGTEMPPDPQPTTTVIRTTDDAGRPTFKTITITPTRPGTPAPTPTLSGLTPTTPAPSRAPGSTVPARSTPATSSPAPAQTTASPTPADTTTPAVTTAPPVTTPPASPPAGGVGDASVVTDPADQPVPGATS